MPNILKVPSEICSLQKLKNLCLYKNQIADISFLQSLTGLTKLNLSDNKITDIPEARYLRSNGNQPSSRYIFDGSYLRLRNRSFGYTLPKEWLSRIHIEKLRVYVSGTNLATITNYKGWDPEVNSDSFTTNFAQGNDFYSPPVPRTILFGFNITL